MTNTHDYSAPIEAFAIGERVHIHPACDTWMRGDRHGIVAKRGRKLVSVKMDTSGRTLRFPPDLLALDA